MEAITLLNSPLLLQCLILYNNEVADCIDRHVRAVLGMQPAELEEFFGDLDSFMKEIRNITGNDEMKLRSVSEKKLSYLKQAILYTLRERSMHKECKSELTHNRAVKKRLVDEVSKISALMEGSWFEETEAFRTPKLTDFLTIQRAEAILGDGEDFDVKKREYDEKFHILNAPTLFLPDIQYYRSACNLRDKAITVAFLDIDDFKKFNTEFGETTVDRDLLPRFMSELEAHVFSHGHAYRFGGDEYVVLLPNMGRLDAGRFLAKFQHQLSEINYIGIEKGPTISIGIIEINEDSALTDQECLIMAEQAKGEAKKDGKDRVAINTGSRVGDNSYEIYEHGRPVD